jgi:hypothetical protein
VEDFHHHFARATLYAEEMNCATSRAIGELRSLGIERVPIDGLIDASFVEREKVRTALRLVADPDDGSQYPAIRFWETMREKLKTDGSTTLVYVESRGATATLWTGDFLCSIAASLDMEGGSVRIESVCDVKAMSHRAILFQAEIERICASWENAEIFSRAGRRIRGICEIRNGLNLNNPETWSDLFVWMEERIQLLRSFVRKGKEADKRKSLLPSRAVATSEAIQPA